jgi:hypothetical protein
MTSRKLERIKTALDNRRQRRAYRLALRRIAAAY